MVAVEGWPTAPYDGSRRSLASLKNLTSDLIGRFCGAVQADTFAAATGPFVRYQADLVVPRTTQLEMAILKGIAAHYVMQADDRVLAMVRQREVLAELVVVLLDRGPDALERPFAEDWSAAPDDGGRRRAVVDQVASLTDASALAWHERLVAPAPTVTEPRCGGSWWRPEVSTVARWRSLLDHLGRGAARGAV